MNTQQLTPQQIVEAEIQSRGEGSDWRVAYLMISKLIEKPEWRLFRSNDTIFLIRNHQDKSKTVEFFIYNGDTENKLTENLKDFFKALKVSGFRQALFNSVGKHTPETIKKASNKIIQSGNKLKVDL